jgi:hypothetical protein
MQSRILVLAAVVFFVVSAIAQQPVPASAKTETNPMQEKITSDFGEGFALDPKFAPLTGDLDLDGTEDLVVVAFGKKPLANSVAKNFKVADPYDAYFGFGDPKVTTGFSDFGDGTSHCVLIVHDWRSEAPKGKFVIVNLPFEELALTNFPHKKKNLTGVAATEYGGLNAVVVL